MNIIILRNPRDCRLFGGTHQKTDLFSEKMNVDLVLSLSDCLSSLISDEYDRRVRGVRATQNFRRNLSPCEESHKCRRLIYHDLSLSRELNPK